jgi:hypothetical protein
MRRLLISTMITFLAALNLTTLDVGPQKQWLRENRMSRKNSPPKLGGVDAPSNKWSRSFEGAAGVVPFWNDVLLLAAPYRACAGSARRLRPLRRLRGIFLNGRSHPS